MTHNVCCVFGGDETGAKTFRFAGSQQRRKPSLAFPRAVCAIVFTVTMMVAKPSPAQIAPQALFGTGTAQSAAVPGGSVTDAIIESQSGKNIPLWTGSFVYQGLNYVYTMVGTNPAAGSVKTKIPVVIIPVKFKFPDGTRLNPTVNVCNGPDTAVNLTVNSPLFQVSDFAPGGTDVGTVQYVDAFQRANFWSTVSTISPNYHVVLQPPTIEPLQTVDVPVSIDWSVMPGSCAPIGHVDELWFLGQAQTMLANLGIHKTALPIFLNYNTFFTFRDPNVPSQIDCCFVGVHAVNGSNNQPYIVSAFIDPGDFTDNVSDVAILSHEIGEWMDDPFGSNPAPGWAVPGEPCLPSRQQIIEPGDPLESTTVARFLNNYTYHLQDLAFVSWFAHQSPSSAVNGWYSFDNTLLAPPPACF